MNRVSLRKDTIVPHANRSIRYLLLVLLGLAACAAPLGERVAGSIPQPSRLYDAPTALTSLTMTTPRAVYLAVPVAVWHYWWNVSFNNRWEFLDKAGTTELWQPILFAGIVGALLLVRVPAVRRVVTTRLGVQKRTKERHIAA